MTQQFNTRPSTNRNLLLAGTAAAALLAASAGLAQAQSLPTGGQVVGGSATIAHTSPTQMQITATTNRSAINWQSFSIAQGYGVNVTQPNATSTQLENVTGPSPSQIFGALSSNGRIVLANPNGIWFGPNAQVDVAGLVATTSSATRGDINTFVNGGSLTMSQAGNADAAIVNQGTITVAQAGLAAFVAPGVSNQGVIQARLGTVQLASGTTPTLDFYGDGLINIAVSGQTLAQAIDPSTGQPLGAAVSNSGAVSANGGTVYITANVASGVVDQTINVSGVVQAQSVSQQNGQMVLNGGSTGTVMVAGTLDASGTGSGETGGTVKVLGNNVELASGSAVNVSGDAGGGTVDVGGDAHGAGPDANANTTTVDKGAVILANAVTSGNGGNVAVWSDQSTSFDGTISAKGGSQSGNGGQVETSGESLTVGDNAIVDASATNGSAGDWLLDPVNGYVTSTGAPPLTDPSAGAISNIAVQNGLATNDVTLTTSLASFTATGAVGATAGTPSLAQTGNLVIAAPITWSSGHNLTLNAWDNLLVEAAITHTGATPATLNLNYNQGSFPGLTAGQLRIYDSNVAASLGGVVTLVAGQDHLNINTQAYTLITDLSQVTVTAGNIAGFYALDANLNNPATNFTGDSLTGGFEGLGHTISNLTIASATTNVTNTTLAPGIGLFGLVASGALVNDVGLIAPTISSTAKTSVNIGTLAGTNLGTISNSWAINGSVTGPTSQPVNNGGEEGEGGLVGTNGNDGAGHSGTILSSFTDNMTVTANGKGSNNGTFFYALGGFVGSNGGTIVGSFASTATVTSTNSSGEGVFAGGFIGDDSLTLSKGNTLPGVVAADIYFGQIPTANGNNATLGSFTANGTCVTASACSHTLTVNLQPDTKVYDGTTDANVTPTASGLIGGDNFLFGLLEEQYSSANVGNSIAMTLANSLLLINYGGSTPSYFYTINTGAGANGIITPAPLTITASDVSTQYGTTPVALTGFNTTGLVNGETITSVTETSTDNVAAQNAGTYTNNIVITPGSEVGGNGFLASNYTITLNPGTLTITPSTSPVVITANNQSTAYGTTPITFTGTEFSVTGLVAGNQIGTVTLTSTDNVANQNAGVYANNIVPSAATSGGGTGFLASNYSSVTYVPGTLTIFKSESPVTITALDQSQNFGSPFVFTGTEFTVTGLVAGNTLITVTLNSAGDTAAAPAGLYPIVPSPPTTGTFNPANYYTVTYVDGTLTVIAPPPPPPPQTLLCAADFPDCTVPHLPNPNVPLSQPGLSLSPGGSTPLAGVNPAAGGADCVNEPNELLRRECIVRQQNQVGANYGNNYLGGQAPRP